MAQHPQGIPQQPQVVYMQQTPTGMASPTGHPQQQQVPMQQIHPQQSQPMAGQRTYQNVTPLASLGRSAAPVDCPACGQRGMTKISHLAGNYAQYVFLLPFLNLFLWDSYYGGRREFGQVTGFFFVGNDTDGLIADGLLDCALLPGSSAGFHMWLMGSRMWIITVDSVVFCLLRGIVAVVWMFINISKFELVVLENGVLVDISIICVYFDS
jgi:hypothetical protein